MTQENLDRTGSRDNSFAVQVNGFVVELPSREDGEWSVKEIVDRARRNPGWGRRKCRKCHNTCMIVPEGTLITAPEEADFFVVSPVEVRRMIEDDTLTVPRV